ncbi:MAG: chromosome segregation protein SMC [Coriobacteriia bacterium]
MYLKSLTMKGFKSFADRTRLVFEPGVNVIVGPNGSGKSNITDAILWVLGEQSAKSLRGQAMEDVIFAGSSARKAVGVCEVDLVLDNSDHVLPLEFDEITITRRMFRSGVSEYLINQTPARLMDILDLLSDSGLGRDTHSIISQGRLDEILNSKPEDRRVLIEEAAGVRKHRKRKEATVRKLKSLEGTIDAIRHILREVDRQLKPLQKQADRAKQHQELAEMLREAEISLAVDELRTLQREWDELVALEKEKDSDLSLLRMRLAEKEAELDRFQSLLEEKGMFVGDLSEQRRRLQAVLERLNSGLLLLEEKGKNLVDRLSDLRAKVHHSETRLASRREEIDRLTAERSETDTQLKSLYQRLNDLRKEGEAVRKARLAAESSVAQIEGLLAKARKRVEDLQAQAATTSHEISSHEFETELLQERLETLAAAEKETSAELSARRARLESLTAAVAKTKKEVALAEADVDKRLRVLASRNEELAEAREEMNSLRAHILALEEVDRAFEGATPALAWVLSKKGEEPSIVTALSDVLDVDEGYESVVEHALGPDLFGVIVTDEDAVLRVTRLLEERESGDLSLLPVEPANVSLAPEDVPGTPLTDFVRCDPVFRPALLSLIGDVRVVDDLVTALAAAKENPGFRFATPSGHVAYPTGKVSLGSLGDTSASVLSRRRRLNELTDARDAMEVRLGELEATVAEAEEAVAAAQQDGLELTQRLATQQAELEAVREDVGRHEKTLASITQEMTTVRNRLAQIAEETDRSRPALAEIEEAIAQGRAEIADLEERLAEAREQRDARYREEAAFSSKLSDCQADIAQVSEREVFLKRNLSVAVSELAELEESLEKARQTEEALELLRERIHPTHELYGELLQTAQRLAEKLKDRASLEQSDSQSLRDTIHELREATRQIQTEIDARSGDLGDIQVQKGQLEVKVKTAVSRIVEGYGVPLERALDRPVVDDREQLEETAHQLRKRLANMGPVNPVAAEEYRALEERREFLQSQLDDVLETRRTIKSLIRKIDKLLEERFNETFEMVDKHFQDVFQVLFPGGHAALTLTDAEDPQDVGVDVVAQPRGKKLKRMSLMSGGEKALVAIALLFALYRTRPCPFYVLDEVEAALDDVNLRRFLDLVEALRDRTQFLVITHQRRTMESADILYGVTMHSDGVSKVVSQRLEQALQHASSAPSSEAAPDEHALV